MIVRKWHKCSDTVTISFTVASVIGKPPLVALSEEVDKRWPSLLGRHKWPFAQLSKVAPVEKYDYDKEKSINEVVKFNTDEAANIELAVHFIRLEQHVSTEGNSSD
ncbi:hypothetical protein Q1695_009022 [Nippostrongylus brasiliensis]|nr:hypothetical protein Q1695_009022 [Nippostrongylus brasiliensis]